MTERDESRDRTRCYKPPGELHSFGHEVEWRSARRADPGALLWALQAIVEAHEHDQDPSAALEHARGVLEAANRPPEKGELSWGSPDELNAQHGTWEWVRVPGQDPEGMNEDGTVRMCEHWSHFRGHKVQVDIEIHTENERRVHSWKGYDEVRAGGWWVISLNHRPALEGHFGSDVAATLLAIHHKLEALLDHSVLTWWTDEERLGLVGRKIYYHDHPAKITEAYDAILVIEGDPGPIPMAYREDDDDREDEHVTDVLDPHIWWWRDRDRP